jgi:hypothetical protein
MLIAVKRNFVEVVWRQVFSHVSLVSTQPQPLSSALNEKWSPDGNGRVGQVLSSEHAEMPDICQ